MKKIIGVLLVVLLLVTEISGVSVYASEIDEESGEVVMIAVPDGNGNLNYYTGDAAKEAYAQITQQSDMSAEMVDELVEQSDLDVDTEVEPDVDTGVEPCGPFYYKYRFIKKRSGRIYGTSRRISNYLDNTSSQNQSLSTNVRSSTTWTINTSLTGGFMEAFKISVGGGWSSNSSFAQTISMNVGPKKRMWLEFKPLVRYVSGIAQKYYIPRGPINNRPIVVESKSVYSTSPVSVYMMIGDRFFVATDGAYVWKERNLR
jgi:hypothetical protein